MAHPDRYLTIDEVLSAITAQGEHVGRTTGQLLCLSCGTAYPLDCHMVGEFSAHVLEHHGFRVDPSRTVLYGLCARCAEGLS